MKGNLWLKSMYQQDKRCNNMTAVSKAFQKNDPLFSNHIPSIKSFKCNMASTKGRNDETLQIYKKYSSYVLLHWLFYK